MEGNSQTIEHEVAELEKQRGEKRQELSRQHESGQITELPHEKQTLHEVVGERIGEYSPPAQPIQPPTDDQQQPAVLPPPVVSDTPAYLSDELKAEVQQLVNLAFTKSIDAAISQARATNNAALIDAFHDALVDELYALLVERGKLKKL